MSKDHSGIQVFPRVPTKIKGMDTLLGGGFLKGGIYLVMGPPGSGKTIFANQMSFAHVARGGRTLYVSLLSEGHSRMFGHLKPMHFFDENQISGALNYISAYHTLEREGLDGLLKSLAQTVRQYKSDLLFIDGVASAEDLAKSPVSFKKFVHDLNTVLSTSGCTAILLSSYQNGSTHPEHTMVDGIISLTTEDIGMRSVRGIRVAKLRGSKHLHGKHIFRIDDNGISVFPRIESYMGRSSVPTIPDPELILPFKIPKLDKMLNGGIPAGTVTSLLGAPGTGKTTLGCQFLSAGASVGEPGLYYGFYESPYRLRKKMEKVKTHLSQYEKDGTIHIVWQPPLEHTIDELASDLLEKIKTLKISRLFVDGINGLRDGMAAPDRLRVAFTALTNELRSHAVTVIFSEETKLFSTESSSPISENSTITDNIIWVRHIESDFRIKRILSVVKTRENNHSSELHEFTISDKEGFLIGQPLTTHNDYLTNKVYNPGKGKRQKNGTSKMGSVRRKK